MDITHLCRAANMLYAGRPVLNDLPSVASSHMPTLDPMLPACSFCTPHLTIHINQFLYVLKTHENLHHVHHQVIDIAINTRIDFHGIYASYVHCCKL
jgi:hypothetical protein